MVVVLLAGMPGAGKEEFLKIAQKKGYEIVRMGDVVREQAKIADLFKEDISIGEFANRERKDHHDGIWADRTLSKVSGEETIIDGIRSSEEVNIFRSELEKDAPIIAVHSSPKTRFERLKERGREDAPQTRAEFQERDMSGSAGSFSVDIWRRTKYVDPPRSHRDGLFFLCLQILRC